MSDFEFQRISVVGLGYIGLPTAAMFSSRGIEVIGVDVNPRTVETINRGEIHIIEPDLDQVVRDSVRAGFLRATTTPEPAEAFIIAVPTPFRDNQQPELGYIEAASNAIAPVLQPGNLVILESTSPVGATEKMTQWLATARPDLSFPQSNGENSDIRIAHCPERVLPGKVMQELVTNDRIIGGITPLCSQLAATLYKNFVSGECVFASGPRVAEMAKLAENSCRDVNIAFANELSMVCDELDLDVWELIELANRHPRVNILKPGPGVGGHCIAVDPWFIVASAPQQSKLIRAAREVNDAKPEWVMNKVRKAIHDHLIDNPHCTVEDISVSVYGLAFKPDIDDFRESPAMEIALKLASEHHGELKIIEPYIDALPPELNSGTLVSMNEPVSSDIHVFLVDHSVFSELRITRGRVVNACSRNKVPTSTFELDASSPARKSRVKPQRATRKAA